MSSPLSRARRGAMRLAAEALLRGGALGLLDRVANGVEPARQADGRVGFPYLRRRRARGLQILLYHRVTDDPGSFLPATPVKVFREQIGCLADRFSILPLAEAVDRLRIGDLPGNAVAVTFDDGYRDNYLHALPILREHGATATIFLATGVIGTDRVLWHDRVVSAFRRSSRRRLSVFGARGAGCVWDGTEERERVMLAVLEELKNQDGDRRSILVEQVIDELEVSGTERHPGLMLSWDEVREMASAGIGFGAHTKTHPILSRVSPERAREEIVDSKLEIERQLEMPVKCFAYPNGRPGDYDETTKRIVREAGYACAVTTLPGANPAPGPGGGDPLELRRTGPWEPVRSLFALRMSLERFVA